MSQCASAPGGGGLLRVKAAEEAAAEAQQGIDREDRQMGGADDALQNGGRRAVAAVGHDAGDVFGSSGPAAMRTVAAPMDMP